MIDFKKLKSMSGKKSLETLSQEINKMTGSNENKADDRFWQPEVDKAGNGYAVVRFLPAPPNEDLPFVRLFEHGFQGPSGLWYIEKSRTTLGKDVPDPCSEYNNKLWNSTEDDNSPERKQARKQKRQLRYISNVYVVSDPANPDNEGKVFLFKYGKKIFEKLNGAMNPEFEDEEAMNPFDFWSGANFKIKIRKVDGYRNYDKSELDKPSPLFDEDEMLEAVWKKQYSLKEFIDPASFKSYDELKDRLNKVLDEKPMATKNRRAEDVDMDDETPPPTIKAKAAPKIASLADEEGGDEDELEFFKKLASKN